MVKLFALISIIGLYIIRILHISSENSAFGHARNRSDASWELGTVGA